MTPNYEPNPPSRREEDFPKTTTIPEGWMTEGMTGAKQTNGRATTNEDTRPTPVVDDESLFTRGLDPFPRPNTIPNGWDLSAM